MLKIRRFYLVLFIAITVLTVYYSAIFAEICSIDDAKMLDGLLNMEGFSFKELFLPGGSGYYYRPLLYLTFIADKYLWGLHESFMHLENVLLHAVNSILVFYIACRVATHYGYTSNAIPLVASLLFALHPLNTEPVNWISGRTDVLAGTFIFIALLLLLKSLQEGSYISLAAAVCSFFTATLAKDTAIFWFPAALFLVYCHDRKRADEGFGTELAATLRFRSGYYAALSAVPMIYFTLRHLAFRAGDGGVSLAAKGVVAGELELFDKIRITLKVFGFYLKKLILPLPLNFATMNVSNWYVVAGIAGILLSLFLLYRRSLLSALVLMSVCIISPALLVPLGRMAWTPMAERYLYMPVATLVIVLAVLAAELVKRLRIPGNVVLAVCLLFVVGSGYTSYRRNLVWQSNLTLFQDCVKKSPDCAPVRNELAIALQNKGRDVEAKKIFLSNVVSETDKYGIVTDINRATSMAANGDIEGGIALLKRRNYDASKPMYDSYLKNLAYLNSRLILTVDDKRKKRGLEEENIELMIKLQAYTGDPYLYYNIGKLYLVIKDNTNASRYFSLAAERSPENAFYKAPAQKLAERLARQQIQTN